MKLLLWGIQTMIDYSIIGKRFGRLVVIDLDHVDEKNKSTWWRCRCDCGNEIISYRGGLTSGDITSCGCFRREHIHEYGRKHGLSRHPLYAVWAGMIQRCTNKNASNYERYGYRGITVCDEWQHNFKSFYDWAIKSGYESGSTLDRIDNDNGYYPENCRWVDRNIQQNNTRRNHIVTYEGETHSIAEWSRILKVNHETLRYRVNKGNMKDFREFKEKIRR